MNTTFLIKFAVIPGLIGFVLWLMLMYWLRAQNFTGKGTRKEDKRHLSDDLLSKQIEYHNVSTYKALEFYLKVLLSVLGGVAYVVLTKSPLDKIGNLLVDAAGWIVVIVSILFCLMVFSHQKAKIERWRFAFRFWSPLSWNETWFFLLGVIVAASARGLVGLIGQ